MAYQEMCEFESTFPSMALSRVYAAVAQDADDVDIQLCIKLASRAAYLIWERLKDTERCELDGPIEFSYSLHANEVDGLAVKAKAKVRWLT